MTLVSPTRRRLVLRAAAATLALPQLSGHAFAAPGAGDREIRLGQSTALTGPLAPVAKEFTDGAAAHLKAINDRGGIHGRKIVLHTVDDGYDAQRTARNVEEMTESGGALAIFGVLGVPNTAMALPIASAAKVPFLFPMNGDAGIRRTPNRYFFTCCASFEDEIDKLVAHFTTIGARRIAVAHLTNPFGQAMLAAAERAAAARNLRLHAVASFDVQADKALPARQLATSGADAILLGAFTQSAAEFVGAFRDTGSATAIGTFSGVGTDLVHRVAGPRSAGLIVSQIVPHPHSPTVPIVREYQAACKASGIASHTYLGLWGYVSARCVTEALRRAGRDVDREKLVNALEGMTNVDLGQYIVDFNRDRHHGSRFADITLLAAGGKLVK